MNAILKASILSKKFTYPQNISLFNELDFSIEPGEIIAIMGASGSGKTTLLHILGTLEEPSSGSIEIQGILAKKSNRSYLRNQFIGFVFQNFHLLDDYTVLENVLMPAKIKRSQGKSHALSLLDRVGMKERLSHEAKLLSGGEKQRVAIARALCNSPQLILADEPTGNLDAHNAACIEELLINLAKKENRSVVIVTHDLQLAKKCNTIFSIEEKKLSKIKI